MGVIEPDDSLAPVGLAGATFAGVSEAGTPLVTVVLGSGPGSTRFGSTVDCAQVIVAPDNIAKKMERRIIMACEWE